MHLNLLTNSTKECTQDSSDILLKSPLLSYINPNSEKWVKYHFLNKVQEQDANMIVNNNQLDVSWLNMYFNRDLRELNIWINKNIVLYLGDFCETTIGVRLRIATSMLNKCYSIDDDKKRVLHTALTHRIWREFYSVVNEQLPFQQTSH